MRTERAWRLALAFRGGGCRLALPRAAPYPARAHYLAVLSHTGGAPAVPPAHARAAVAGPRGARVIAIAGFALHGAGVDARAAVSDTKNRLAVVWEHAKAAPETE